MEIAVRSPISGKVAKVWVNSGTLLNSGDALVTIEAS